MEVFAAHYEIKFILKILKKWWKSLRISKSGLAFLSIASVNEFRVFLVDVEEIDCSSEIDVEE